MKKAISSLLLSAMMLASAQPLQVNAATTPTISTRTEVLKVAETVDGETVPAGTMKVSVIISNNTGYTGSGIRIPINPNKVEPLRFKTTTGDHDEGECIFSYGPASDGLYVEFADYQAGQKNLAFGTMSSSRENKKNGVIFSVYLKSNQANVNLANVPVSDVIDPVEIDKFVDKSNEAVDPTVPEKIEVNSTTPPKGVTYTTKTVTDYTYKLGDVNGDNIIDLEDAQAICNLLYDETIDDYKSYNVNAQNSQITYAPNSTYKGLFFKLAHANDDAIRLDLNVADVDGNKVVNIFDAQLILHNYTRASVSGLTSMHSNCYKCNQGKNLGKKITHTSKIYTVNCP